MALTMGFFGCVALVTDAFFGMGGQFTKILTKAGVLVALAIAIDATDNVSGLERRLSQPTRSNAGAC